MVFFIHWVGCSCCVNMSQKKDGNREIIVVKTSDHLEYELDYQELNHKIYAVMLFAHTKCSPNTDKLQLNIVWNKDNPIQSVCLTWNFLTENIQHERVEEFKRHMEECHPLQHFYCDMFEKHAIITLK